MIGRDTVDMLFNRGHANGTDDPDKLYEDQLDTGLVNINELFPIPGYAEFMKARFDDAVVKQGTGNEERKWVDKWNYSSAFVDCFLAHLDKSCWNEYTALIM